MDYQAITPSISKITPPSHNTDPTQGSRGSHWPNSEWTNTQGWECVQVWSDKWLWFSISALTQSSDPLSQSKGKPRILCGLWKQPNAPFTDSLHSHTASSSVPSLSPSWPLAASAITESLWGYQRTMANLSILWFVCVLTSWILWILSRVICTFQWKGRTLSGGFWIYMA